MGWWDFRGVLSACSVALGSCPGIPGTRPRSALELSEQVVGYEPESTKGGGRSELSSWLPAVARGEAWARSSQRTSSSTG